MEPDEARAAIDGWFRDRSTDDATALEAFRVVALSERTSAAELGELRLRFVDYLVATRGIERAAAVKIASVRMDSWFAGARQATSPDVSETPWPGPPRRNRGGLRGVRDRRRLAPAAPGARARLQRRAVVLGRRRRGVDRARGDRGTPRPERFTTALYAATPIAVAGLLLLAGA